MLSWRIPNDVQLGQVVSNIFTDQNAEQYLIRLVDFAEENEQALIMQELLRDDPIIRALDFDRASLESLMNSILMYLNQNITVGCFTTNENVLVSVDCLYVRSIWDKDPESTNDMDKASRSFIKYIQVIRRLIKSDRAKDKCNYMTSFGVFTSPAYRNTGIPSEMIRMRNVIAKALRIEVIGSAFIGKVMLEAAKKHNYKLLQTFRRPQDMMNVDLDDEDFDFKEIFPIKIMSVVRRYDPL